MLSTYLTRHSTLCIPPLYSRPHLLVRKLLVSTGPSQETWLNYSFLWSERAWLTSPVLSPFRSIYSTSLKLLLPFGVEVSSDHIQYISKTKPRWTIRTINVFANSLLLQLNTPKQKTHDGWIHSSSSWLLLDWENCTTITTDAVGKGNHGQITPFLVKPNMCLHPCLSFISKSITNLHYTWSTLIMDLAKECMKENER